MSRRPELVAAAIKAFHSTPGSAEDKVLAVVDAVVSPPSKAIGDALGTHYSEVGLGREPERPQLRGQLLEAERLQFYRKSRVALTEKLRAAGAEGLDGSPGDPVCAAAAEVIEQLTAEVNAEWGARVAAENKAHELQSLPLADAAWLVEIADRIEVRLPVAHGADSSTAAIASIAREIKAMAAGLTNAPGVRPVVGEIGIPPNATPEQRLQAIAELLGPALNDPEIAPELMASRAAAQMRREGGQLEAIRRRALSVLASGPGYAGMDGAQLVDRLAAALEGAREKTERTEKERDIAVDVVGRLRARPLADAVWLGEIAERVKASRLLSKPAGLLGRIAREIEAMATGLVEAEMALRSTGYFSSGFDPVKAQREGLAEDLKQLDEALDEALDAGAGLSDPDHSHVPEGPTWIDLAYRLDNLERRVDALDPERITARGQANWEERKRRAQQEQG